ncbi:hypothetical protein FIU87_16190 [Bacillus sp. THAF10]|uniref:hypothetical protein n=1 Tax=Bacillus sp. THAF10 TaxID=2587848 RepID=UPI0012683DC8|nr:hypothetical protein [Bacillus sp. THAF10]QFT90204.1 hypothetical protein FIU87_16190 [Bacillus sp. THAF10]
MYKETQKEKIIRFTIIALIGIFIMYLFMNQYASEQITVDTKPIKQLALTLQESNQHQDTPKLAMIREYDGKPTLIIYRVNKEKNYLFETISAVTLDTVPQKLKKDKSSDGVWVETSGSWTYYNESLETEAREEHNILDERNKFSYSVEKSDDKYSVSVENDQGVLLEKTLNHEPKSIIRLSENNDLWFVLFEKESILLVP